MKAEPYSMYTIVDADRMEKVVTHDYTAYTDALRERNRLALRYGKEWCLRVAGIDRNGQLHEIDDPPDEERGDA